jgi:hypothetical protein
MKPFYLPSKPVKLLIPVVLGALLLGACGRTTPATTTTSTTTSSTTTTVISTTTGEAVQKLNVTAAVRLSLLDADAAYHQLPTTDYTGLIPAMTYYAFDPADHTYFAAAGLVPSKNSLKAQIGVQDDGGYNLFTKLSGSSTWTVYDDGLGAAQDSTCPITIPAGVLAAWNWKVKSCFPPQ